MYLFLTQRDQVYQFLAFSLRKSLRPRCILIDSLRNVLRPAMAIVGHRAHPIVVGKMYNDGSFAQPIADGH